MKPNVLVYRVDKPNKLVKLSTCNPCGLVIGFSWKELTQKFQSIGLRNVQNIRIDDYGLHVYHEGDGTIESLTINGGKKAKKKFNRT